MSHRVRLHQKRQHPPGPSGMRGVKRDGNRWVAVFCLRYEAHYLGSFESAEAAGRAYDAAARKIYGIHAMLNFPVDEAVWDYYPDDDLWGFYGTLLEDDAAVRPMAVAHV